MALANLDAMLRRGLSGETMKAPMGRILLSSFRIMKRYGSMSERRVAKGNQVGSRFDLMLAMMDAMVTFVRILKWMVSLMKALIVR